MKLTLNQKELAEYQRRGLVRKRPNREGFFNFTKKGVAFILRSVERAKG